MLPFLQPKKIGSTIMAKRSPKGKEVSALEEGEKDPGLMVAAEDLISAVHAKDANAVAAALEAAFQMFDAAPHVEGEHLDGDI